MGDMRLFNTNPFEGWFTFEQACANRSFYAVEMGLCQAPLSLAGFAMWVLLTVVLLLTVLIMMQSEGGRATLLFIVFVGGGGWLFYGINSGTIPQWVTQTLGGLLIGALLIAALYRLALWFRANPKWGYLVCGIYAAFVVLMFFAFEQNVGEWWGEMIGLPVLATIMIIVLGIPVVSVGQWLLRAIRREPRTGD
jgi:hypothetical protein